MNNKEIRACSKILLKSKYAEAFVIIMSCIIIFLLFKIIEVGICAILIWDNEISPYELFYSDNELWNIFTIILAIARFLAMIPVINGLVWWFSQAVKNKNASSDSIIQLYASLKLNLRGGMLYAFMWINSVIALIPSVVLAFAGYYIIIHFPQNANMLFLSVQLFVLSVFSLGIFIRILLSQMLAPFIFMKYPLRNPVKIIIDSFKLMRGRKKQALRLILSYIKYLPLMILILPIPFILSSIFMAVSVFAEDAIS